MELALGDVLQLVVVVVLLPMMQAMRQSRNELVQVRERLAAVETAVEIGLGVKVKSQKRGES